MTTQVLEDWTTDLKAMEKKDVIIRAQGVFHKQLALQNPLTARHITYEKAGWGGIIRVEEYKDGTPTQFRAPKRMGRSRRGESETKDAQCHSFKTKDGHLFLEIGGANGIIINSIARSLKAQRKERYDVPLLDLIQIYPDEIDLGEAPCESMKKRQPEVVLEKRHGLRGDVMVEAFYDYIEERPFEFFLRIDSESPLNKERIVALLKSLNNLNRKRPSGRNNWAITKIERIANGD